MSIAFIVTSVDPARREAVRDLLASLDAAAPNAWVGLWSTYPVLSLALDHSTEWPERAPDYPTGLNEAFRYVRDQVQDANLIVKVDDDISMLRRDWYDELVWGMVRHPDAILGAKLLRPDGSVQHAGGFLLRANGSVIAGHYGEVIEVDTEAVDFERPVEFVTGAFFGVPLSIWDDIGPFEQWGAWEDSEYCFRARAKGYETWYLPKVVLRHGTGQAERARDPEVQAAYMKRQQECARKFAARYAADLYPKASGL